MSWLERAACRDADTAVFFRVGKTHSNADALRVCAGCRVRRECLEEALAVEHNARSERFGVRGGMTAEERHQLVRQRRDWREIERSWRAWRLERDRIELHRSEWPTPIHRTPPIRESIG